MNIEIKGLDQLVSKFRQWPDVFRREARETMNATNLVVWEAVPPYPPKPQDSTYQRTGTLGRTLGIGGSQPDIYEVTDKGNYFESRFGTRLDYAPYVVGDYVEEQAGHMRHWWTLPQDVVRRAEPKIIKLWENFVVDMADWLKGKGA